VLLALLLAGLSIFHTVRNLDFKTSRNDLIADTEPAVERFSEISDDFGNMTNVIVAVEGKDPERMKAFMKELASRLVLEPQFFAEMFYQIDTSSLEGKKLLFLSAAELDDLAKKLADYGELIEDLGFSPRVATILEFVNQKISEATVTHLVKSFLGGDETETSASDGEIAPAEAEEEKKPVDLSFLRSLLTEMRLALQTDYYFKSPWDTFFKTSSKFSEDGFLFSDDQRFLFMTLSAKSEKDTFAKKHAALSRLREHIGELLSESYPDLDAGVTGGSALADDEMTQSMKDAALASAIALVCCGVVFMVGFRQVLNPLLALFSLTLATCWTFGMVTVSIGYLSILSVAFTSIMLGVGDDFGIHIIARYTEERDSGQSHEPAMRLAYEHTGKAIIAGGVTTAAAFFAIMLADFKGIQELGFIGGMGIVLTMIAAFTVLPALLSLSRNYADRRRHDGPSLKAWFPFLRRAGEYRGYILGAFAVVSLFCLMGLTEAKFDYNLLNLQAKGTESVEWEQRITAGSSRSSWFAVTSASTLDEAREKENRFKALPTVRKVDSVADLVPVDQSLRLEKVRELRPLVEGYDFDSTLAPELVDPERLLDVLEKIKFKLRTDTKWDPQKRPDEVEIATTREALLQLIAAVKEAGPDALTSRLKPFQASLFRDFSSKFTLLRDNTDPSGPLVLDEVPTSLRKRFIGKSGQFLLQVYSRESIWEKENMTNFVRELRSVDPYVTGPPVVGLSAIETMHKGYLQGGMYAMLVQVLVIGWMFRKLKDTALALTPLMITMVWTVGWMGWLGIPFNLANLLGLPLIIGAAEDYGVHIVHRYNENPNQPHELVSSSTAQGINIASWTTMTGFASLMVAKHYGVFSLGLVVTIAIGIAWLLSVVVLPVMLYKRER
jgi:hopanoid biosynthesis associated RND transporter like protein HpnN